MFQVSLILPENVPSCPWGTPYSHNLYVPKVFWYAENLAYLRQKRWSKFIRNYLTIPMLRLLLF